jgi:hypothetical protein
VYFIITFECILFPSRIIYYDNNTKKFIVLFGIEFIYLIKQIAVPSMYSDPWFGEFVGSTSLRV